MSRSVPRFLILLCLAVTVGSGCSSGSSGPSGEDAGSEVADSRGNDAVAPDCGANCRTPDAESEDGRGTDVSGSDADVKGDKVGPEDEMGEDEKEDETGEDGKGDDEKGEDEKGEDEKGEEVVEEILVPGCGDGDCKDGETKLTCHKDCAEAWMTKDNPDSHGAAFFAGPSECTACHGPMLESGVKSCNTCHPYWKTNCTFCHGGKDNDTGAPPFSLFGLSAVTEKSVGAHTQHLEKTAANASDKEFGCAECHPVPADALSPGHVNGSVDVVFGSFADHNAQLTPQWDGETCSSVYCHGATLGDGGIPEPQWTDDSGDASACGACHGNPPEDPHPQSASCWTCHADTVAEGGGIVAGSGAHINGVPDVSQAHPDGFASPDKHGAELNQKGPAACTGCHGADLLGGTANKSCESCHPGWKNDCTFCHGGKDNQTGAPPWSVFGLGNKSDKPVGAHTLHLSDTALKKAYACNMCHAIPDDAMTAGHIDGDSAAEVALSDCAGGDYDLGSGTCSSVYCHGNGKNLTSGGSVKWTGAALTCQSCHPNGSLGGKHDEHLEMGFACDDCHNKTVTNTGTIKDPALHVNCTKDVSSGYYTWTPGTKTCSSNVCHPNEKW